MVPWLAAFFARSGTCLLYSFFFRAPCEMDSNVGFFIHYFATFGATVPLLSTHQARWHMIKVWSILPTRYPLILACSSPPLSQKRFLEVRRSLVHHTLKEVIMTLCKRYSMLGSCKAKLMKDHRTIHHNFARATSLRGCSACFFAPRAQEWSNAEASIMRTSACHGVLLARRSKGAK